MRLKRIVAAVTSAALLFGNVSVTAFADAGESVKDEKEAVYVLMNIPYSEFYAADVDNEVPVDVVSSATKIKPRNPDKTTEGSYHHDESGSEISGVTFPVKLSADIDLSVYKEVTDEDVLEYTIADKKGDIKVSRSGAGALYENEDYAYYVLDETPAYYKEASIEDGKLVFGEVTGESEELKGVEVSLLTSSKYGDYQLNVTGADFGTVYGVVIATDEAEYALRHLENIYKKGNQLAWSVGNVTESKGCRLSYEHTKAILGQTISSLTYYTDQGIKTISGLELTVAEYALVNIPYDVFYEAVGADGFSVDAVSSATNKVGNVGKAGGAYHSAKTAEIAEDGTVTAVGGANGAHLEGVTWPVKVSDFAALKALGGNRVTDAAEVVVATLGRGATSSVTLKGAKALIEQPSYSYYALAKAPAYYLEFDIDEDGEESFIVPADEKAVISEGLEAKVSYGTNWGDVQLAISGIGDAADAQISAVVLTNEDSKTAGLIQLYNVWSPTEIAWRYESFDGFEGTKITNIRYYINADGEYEIYDFPVEITLLPEYKGDVRAEFTDAKTIVISGLGEELENPVATVYHTTGGRNAVVTYLTPFHVDPDDGDIEPDTAPIKDGVIELTTPADKDTEYNIIIGSDNYVAIKTAAEYIEPAVTGISLNFNTVYTTPGKSFVLDAEIEPANAFNKNISYSSSDESVASVDENGKVTAKKIGSAVISVVSEDGELSDSCYVTVEFSDVRTVDKVYYYKPVYWAAEKGITKGFTDADGFARRFGAGEECTRAQMVTFLWRVAGSPNVDVENPFSDISKSDYYYKAVLWASENGITKGFTDGTFRPDDNCLREQAVTFLWRYAGKPEAGKAESFSDVAENTYYYKAVIWAAENGITKGYAEDNTFRPANNCLREQIITFLYRVSE